VTVVASLEKIFSTVPAVGYWAQHCAVQGALAEGKTSFGSAKNIDAMEAVVRNTAVQGSLSSIFLVLSVIVIVFARVRVVQAFRSTDVIDHEDPEVPSRRFAPAGILASREERALEKEWEALPADLKPVQGH
jgi:carbon starvation protein